MAKVEIYTTSYCPFCHRAKALLRSYQVNFTEIDVEHEPQKRQEMQTRAQRNTVPQIFIDDKAIGGCDDLYALDAQGKLKSLLHNH